MEGRHGSGRSHVESHLENLGFKNRKPFFFTSLRHALSDLGIDFDILRDKHVAGLHLKKDANSKNLYVCKDRSMA